MFGGPQGYGISRLRVVCLKSVDPEQKQLRIIFLMEK